MKNEKTNARHEICITLDIVTGCKNEFDHLPQCQWQRCSYAHVRWEASASSTVNVTNEMHTNR